MQSLHVVVCQNEENFSFLAKCNKEALAVQSGLMFEKSSPSNLWWDMPSKAYRRPSARRWKHRGRCWWHFTLLPITWSVHLISQILPGPGPVFGCSCSFEKQNAYKISSSSQSQRQKSLNCAHGDSRLVSIGCFSCILLQSVPLARARFWCAPLLLQSSRSLRFSNTSTFISCRTSLLWRALLYCC